MKKVQCPYCLAPNDDLAIYCSNCGRNIGDASNTPSEITRLSEALAAKYEIVGLIGQGGMAKVYKAIHKGLERMVALKVIHSNLIHDRESLSRFRLEAKSSASLLHPNIVMVYDEGKVEDIVYMALEYLEGEDLLNILKQYKTIPYKKTLRYITPIANALNYVHNKKLVHRDIKSSNIFITNEGRPVLTDFGIASAKESLGGITVPGSIIGTPEYMSPEQANDQKIDGRSDIYSLGVVLYQCLAGIVPLRGETPISTILKISQEIPKPVYKLNDSVPKWFSDIIDKCLQKNPEYRFQTGKELGNALNSKGKSKNIIEDPNESNKTDKEEKDPETDEDVFESHFLKGEKYFDDQDYELAYKYFKDALHIKPKDNYLTEKIKHLELILESIDKARKEKQKIDKNYLQYVEIGNKEFEIGNYREALKSYNKALELKRFERYPKNKINEINKIFNQIQKRKNEFENTLLEIGQFIKDNNFRDARKLILKVSDKYKDIDDENRLKEVQDKLDEAKFQFEESAAINKVNEFIDFFSRRKPHTSFEPWLERIDRITKEVEIFQASKNLLGEFKEEVIKLQHLEEKEQKKLERFKLLFTKAQTLIINKFFDKGIEALNMALELFPENKEALALLKTSEALKSEIQKQKQEIESLIKRANEAFDIEDFERSISLIEKALLIDPDDRSLKILLDRTKKSLFRKKEKEKKEAEIFAKYKVLFNEAVRFENGNKLKNALQKFNAARSLKETDEVMAAIEAVSDKISDFSQNEDEIRIKRIRREMILDQLEILIENKRLQSAEKKWMELVELSDSSDQQVKEIRIKIDHLVDELNKLKEFDGIINQSNDLISNGKLSQALETLQKAHELFPGNELVISRIQIIKDKIEFNQKFKESEVASKNQAYKLAIKRAKDLLEGNNLFQAISAFEIAKSLNPDASYPNEKIEEINKLLIDKDQLKELKKKKDSEFSITLNKGFEAYKNGQYREALKLYNRALKVKPEEEYLKDRIALIEEKIEKKEAETDKSTMLNGMLLQADTLLDAQKFEEAKTLYDLILKFKHESKAAKEQIRNIGKRINENKRKKEIEQQTIDRYKAFIDKGDKYYDQKDFETALKLYEQANDILSHEYAKHKIALTKFAIEAEKRIAKENENKKIVYNNYMLNADRLYQEGNKKEALQVYKIVLYEYPDDPLIKEKISQIGHDLQKEEKFLSKGKDDDRKFLKFINHANSFLQKNDLTNSRKNLINALKIKPDNSLAKNQLDLVENLIKERQSHQNSGKNKQDSAVQIIELVLSFEEKDHFDQALASLNLIRDTTQKALKGKIRTIEGRIKGKLEKQKKETAKNQEYDGLLSQAFLAFKGNNFEKAIKFYEKASVVKPNENYPKDRIVQIRELLSDNNLAVVKEEEINEILLLAKQLNNKENWDEAIDSYRLLLDLTGDKKYEKIIMSIEKKRKNKPEKEQKEKTKGKDVLSIAKGDNKKPVSQKPSDDKKDTGEENEDEFTTKKLMYNRQLPLRGKLKTSSRKKQKQPYANRVLIGLIVFLLIGLMASVTIIFYNDFIYPINKTSNQDELAIGTTDKDENNSGGNIDNFDSLKKIYSKLQSLQNDINNLGTINTKGKASKAIEYYKYYDKLYQQNESALHRMYSQSKFSNFRIEINNLETSIGKYESYFKLAENYFQINDIKNAEKYRKEALKIFPGEKSNNLFSRISINFNKSLLNGNNINNGKSNKIRNKLSVTCNYNNVIIKTDNSGKRGFYNNYENLFCGNERYDLIEKAYFMPKIRSKNIYYKIKNNGKMGLIRVGKNGVSILAQCNYDKIGIYNPRTYELTLIKGRNPIRLSNIK
jgi:serine/threonine protein kinase